MAKLETSISGFSMVARRISSDIVGTPEKEDTLCFSINSKALIGSHLYIRTIFVPESKERRKFECEPVTWNKGTAARVHGFSGCGKVCASPSTSKLEARVARKAHETGVLIIDLWVATTPFG